MDQAITVIISRMIERMSVHQYAQRASTPLDHHYRHAGPLQLAEAYQTRRPR